MESKSKVLQKLFLSTLYLSAFTFGGGYVIVTLMKKKFVDEYHWIEEKEMLDLVAIGGDDWCAGFDYWNDYSAVSDYLCDFGLLSGVPG